MANEPSIMAPRIEEWPSCINYLISWAKCVINTNILAYCKSVRLKTILMGPVNYTNASHALGKTYLKIYSTSVIVNSDFKSVVIVHCKLAHFYHIICTFVIYIMHCISVNFNLHCKTFIVNIRCKSLAVGKT